MRHRLTIWLAALVTFTFVPSAMAGDETVALRWKFEAGKVAYVVADQDMHMDTTTGPGAAPQKQSQTGSSVLEMKTVSVDADGTGTLSIRFLRMDGTFDQGPMVMKIHVVRSDSGEIDSKVDITTAVAGMEAVKPLMEQVMKGIFKVDITTHVKATGEIVSTTVNGDPFAGIQATDDPMSKMLVPMFKSMMNPEDMFGQTVNQLFVRMPAEPVKVGGSWDTSTTTEMFGMKLDAHGKAHLASVDGTAPSRVAKLEEDLSCDIDLTGYTAKLRKSMSEMLPGLGEIKFKADPMTMPRSIDFDVDGGHIKAVRVPSIRTKMTGTIGVKAGDTETNTEMTMVGEGKSSFRYESELPK